MEMECMPGTEDGADPGRLIGRRPAPPPPASADAADSDELEADDDAEIEAVTRLMGFLRGGDDDG
jgi:hypothetical protein